MAYKHVVIIEHGSSEVLKVQGQLVLICDRNL